MAIPDVTFDPAWAAVRVVVDGGMWPSSVDTITITRIVAGEPPIVLRGVDRRAVVGGTYVGSDAEAPLEASVTYQVDGYLGAVFVASATGTVSTAGTVVGLWIKVAGVPDLTAHARLREVSEIVSPTIGGVYQIAGGGGAVAQTTAQWSGIESDTATVRLSAEVGAAVDRLRAALAAARVVLLQPVGSTDLDAGWYLVANVRRSNPAQMESFSRRWFELDVQRTGVPTGTGAGIAGTTWAALMDAYPTWADVLAAKATWFDVLKGF